MINLNNNILKESAPKFLQEFVASCTDDNDLVARVEKDPARLFSFVQNMKTEGNEQLASRLSMFLCKLAPEQLENPEIKKVETFLRNRGMLNPNRESDISLQLEKGITPVKAHKAILALESPYFMAISGFKESQKGELVIKEEGIRPWTLQTAIDYLYLSDEKRKELISNVDKQTLLEMARLANLWQNNELKAQCDEELCNSIGQLNIEKGDIKDWLEQAQFTPKFSMLVDFISTQAGDGDGSFEKIIEQMQTPAGAAQLVAKCSPKEVALFSTLKTEFGKALQIPSGAFGKVEWENAFPVTITEVPPLPSNIHAILEQDDPCEPGKKLKETCQLFLRPEKVILHEKDSDKEIMLGFDGVEELAMKATNPDRRTKYKTLAGLRNKMNQMPAAKSGWVLMRKEVIPGSRDKSFQEQQQLLKGGFAVPMLMDAVLLNIITYANEGKCLYGTTPRTYTRCQEKYGDQAIVGGFDSSGLYVTHYLLNSDYHGLAGSWKF